MPKQNGVQGQAMLETVLVFPLGVLLILGIVQLTSLQQAKLLTTYAAFQAARAGIVWNGSNDRMHDAALWSLLPTVGSTRSREGMARTYLQFTEQDAAARAFWGPGEGTGAVNGSSLRGLVRVETLSPAAFADLDDVWKLRRGPTGWEELDADDVTSFVDHPELETRFRRFTDLTQEDPEETLLRKATLLTVRVRYLYELRIPLANALIFTAWSALTSMRKASAVAPPPGLASLLLEELQTLRRLAKEGGRYFIPLSTTYTLRMQSSFHRKWVVHENPSWTP